MRLKASWVYAAPFVLSAGLAASGCAFFVGAHEARVAQGQPVQTGQAAYDDFFAEVLEVREEASRAPDKHAGVNKPLADAMGLEESASPEDTVAEAAKRASELEKVGLLLHLELTPDARVVHVQKKKGALDEQSQKLLKAVEASAKKALAAVDELGTVRARAAKLEKTRVELISQSAADFDEEAPIARSAVQQELDASKGVIADAEAESGRQAGLAAKFIVDLARAIETGAGSSKPYSPPPPPPAAPPPAPKPAWRPQPVKPKPPPADFDP
jgi:translation initiation factor IF-3